MSLDLETDGRPKDRSWIAIPLAFVAAAALIFAAASGHWLGRIWPKSKVAVTFGLVRCTNCGTFANWPTENLSNGEFMTHYRDLVAATGTAGGPWRALGMKDTNEVAASVSHKFAPLGIATLVLCFASALGLISLGVLALAKRRKERKISPSTLTLLALFASLITVGLFLSGKPFGTSGIGVQYSFWAYAGGFFLGLIAAQMLAKSIRPPEVDPLAAQLG